MERARKLIGMPICTPNGQRVGEVWDVLLDDSARQMVGLAVVSGNILRRQYSVRQKDIVGISRQNITIKNQKCLIREPLLGKGLRSSHSPLGHQVVTTGDNTLGRIRDVLMHKDMVNVWGFEISDGLVRDVLEGSVHLPRQLVKRFTPIRGNAHMIDESDGKPTPRGGED